MIQKKIKRTRKKFMKRKEKKVLGNNLYVMNKEENNGLDERNSE